jgi:hypothetical protein
MFDLYSKIDPNNPLPLSIKDMSLLKTVMMHSGVPYQIIQKFSTSSGGLIGEKVGKDIAAKLDETLPRLRVDKTLIEQKVITDKGVQIKATPVSVGDLIIIKAFSIFNKEKAPYEIF